MLGALGLTGAATAQTAAAEKTTGPLNFTFVHTSDSHVSTYFTMPDSLEDARSWVAVRTLKDLGQLFLRPYKTWAHTPSFIIHTGDITEFGYAGVTEQVVDRYFGDLGFKVFYQLGNHDNTWVPPLRKMEERFGGMNYSFDFLGVHFIGINSAGVQDPRPTFGEEAIQFVKRDLQKVAKTTPIILFFHHPLSGSEWSSTYDYHRLTDAVKGHNVILGLMGHGHGAVRADYDGFPAVMGGSPFSKSKDNNNYGYNIISLDGEKLRVAYRLARDEQATKPLIEIPIPKKSVQPVITPTVSQTGSGENRQIVLRATVSQSVYALRNARYVIDDVLSGPLTLSGTTATGQVPAKSLASGAHFVRFEFDTSESDLKFSRSMTFAIESGTAGTDPVAAWRYQMGGASRTRPVLYQGQLLVGGLDGVFYSVDAETGKPVWRVEAGSPITAGTATFKDLVIFGTAGGTLKAVTLNGQSRWDFAAGRTIMGHPVVVDGMVYFASNDAMVYCLDAATGEQKWVFEGARENVETAVVVSGGKVYLGAWDGNVYCLDAATGKQQWKSPGPRNQTSKQLPPYYAPADAEMVLLGDKLYATDRAYHSGSYKLDGSFIKSGPSGAAAFSPAGDGKHLYLRRSGSPVCKVDADLNIVWESDITGGALPYRPVEAGGSVYGVTSTGTLYSLDAATGQRRWTYSVTPKLYVHTVPTVGNGKVYTVGQDGVITAVRIPNGG